MIIHMDGTAQELLEFVKGMQFPIAHYAFGVDEEAENEAADRGEIENDVEQMFTETKAHAGEYAKPWTVTVELDRIQWVMLMAEAEKGQMSTCDLAAEIITDWLARQKYVRK